MAKLGELLVRENMLTLQQLQKAQDEQRKVGGRLGTALTKLGFTAYEPYGWAKVAAGLESSFAIVSYPVLLVTIARKIWR